jgi:hypothetical protein
MSSSKKPKHYKREKQLKRSKKRLEARKRERFEPLMKKLEKQGLTQGKKFVYEPAGEVKMSEVLGEFIDPYIEETRNKEEYETLLMIAIMAWNTALLPENAREEMFEKAFAKAMPPMPEEIKEIIYELIERKDRYFPQYTRQILNFELTDTGHDYHLSVISTL